MERTDGEFRAPPFGAGFAVPGGIAADDDDAHGRRDQVDEDLVARRVQAVHEPVALAGQLR